MAMTETRPAGTDDQPIAASPAPAEPAGLAGWLSTSDHKRVGRMWLATSLFFLVGTAVLGELLAVERLDSGADLLKDGSFAQVFTLHGEALALLSVVPFLLGLAIYLVPLQIGSPELAFPRGAAAAFWGYLIGGGLLVGAYATDGGITGTTPTSVDLSLLSLAVIALSLTLAAGCVVTTVLTMRAPGMTLLRTPLFSWSVLVGGGLLLLQLPILVARLVELFIPFHYAGQPGSYAGIEWLWSVPAVYGLVVMGAGALLEVVPTLAGRALRFHVAGMVVIGLLGVLGLGGWLLDPEAADDLLFVGMGLAAVIPPLALLGTLGDTARAGSPKLKAPLVLAIASALLLLAGAAAGAVGVIEPLELTGTTWDSGQTQLVLFGGGVLAAFAGMWFWAPKIWGAHLSERAGFLVALLVLGGVALSAGPDLVVGAADDLPRGAIEFEETDLATATGGIGVAGAGLAALGVLVAAGAALGAGTRRRGVPAVDDPWGGWTLEWKTSSPPPADNFAKMPEITEP
jgi:heme/copper-type cytochrome/quinol oxidase subunit 1